MNKKIKTFLALTVLLTAINWKITAWIFLLSVTIGFWMIFPILSLYVIFCYEPDFSNGEYYC